MEELNELRERIDELEDELKGGGSDDEDLTERSDNETIRGFIYKLYHVDHPETFYIGSTTKRLSLRLSRHKSEAKRLRCNSSLYTFMREQGIDSFTIESIEEVDVRDKEQLRLLEQRYIQNTSPLLNEKRAHITPEQKRESDRVYNRAHIGQQRAWREANAHKFKCSCSYHTYNKPNLMSHLRYHTDHHQL